MIAFIILHTAFISSLASIVTFKLHLFFTFSVNSHSYAKLNLDTYHHLIHPKPSTFHTNHKDPHPHAIILASAFIKRTNILVQSHIF